MTALNLDTYSLSLITAKEDILSDRTSTDWAVFTYEKKWSLKLLDSGVGGLEELIKKLNKNLIQYGLCRVSVPNTGVRRLLLIHWVGENVDALRREVTNQHLPAIRRFFKEADVLLAAQKVEDITQELVAQALSRVPLPARAFQKPRISVSHDVVGTKYMKTNPAVEMKISKREAFWQRSEREEERRKETERLRLQEERIALERERIERERLEEEERDRRIQEKERLVEEQRKEQARLEVERRRLEKERWAQQQKEYEEELKGRFKRSQSIEMAAEAAALVSGRSLHPRDFFRQQERSVSGSFSPPSTPSSPSKTSSGFFSRTTLRYQRSMTESILTPTSRSPTFFQGFQKRDSFSSPSASTPQTCSPAFIFSKSPLPGTSPMVDSLPSFIPPPISATRVTPTQVKGSPPPALHTPPRTGSEDLPFRAEYVTVSPAEHNAATLNTRAQARPQHQDLHSGDTPSRAAGLYRAELVAIDAPSTSHSEMQELPNKIAKSPTNFTAIKAAMSISASVTEVAFTSPAPFVQAKIPAALQSTEKVVPLPSSALGGTQPTTSAAEITTPTPIAQALLASALSTQEGINKTSNNNFCSDETAMSTNSALSHEPKISCGSTSLVSLLAPIPYTPYRTQRIDSSSLRSSFSTAALSPHASLGTPPLVTFGIASPEALPNSTIESLESKYPPIGEVTQNSSTRTTPVTVSVHPTGGSAESQLNIIHTNTSLTTPIEISAKFQPYTIQADDLLPESLRLSSSIGTESTVGLQLCNIHTDIPLVESSHECPFITAEGSSNQLNVKADTPVRELLHEPPSKTTEGSSGQLNAEMDIPIIEPGSSCITTEGSSGQINDQMDIPILESSPGSSCITTEGSSNQLNVQADILLTELSNLPPSITTEGSSNQRNILPNTPVIELTHEPPPSKTTEESSDQLNDEMDISIIESLPGSLCITTEGSSGQLNVQVNTPVIELSHEPPCKTTEGSSDQLNDQIDISIIKSSPGSSCIATESSSVQLNVQADTPVIKLPHEPPSKTTEGSFGQLNDEMDIPVIESSPGSSCITNEGSSGQLNVQADTPVIQLSHEPLFKTTEVSSDQLNDKMDIPIVESSLGSPCITTESSSVQLNVQAYTPVIKLPNEPPSKTTEGSFGQLNDEMDILVIESSPGSSCITNEGSSGQLNVQADTPVIEFPREPPSKTAGSSSGQLNAPSDIPMMESSSGSSCIITEETSIQLSIQADIPLLEFEYEPPSTTTEGFSDQLILQADISLMESSSGPSWISTEGSSAPHLTNIQTDIPLLESSSESSYLMTEGFSGQLYVHVDSPLVETAYKSPSITTEASAGQLSVQADIPVMESPSELSWITSEGSLGSHSDNIHAHIPLVEPSHEPPSIITEGSSGQLNIQTDIPLLESATKSSCITIEGYSDHLYIQADSPLVEPAYKSTSITTEGSTSQLNIQAHIQIMESSSESSWITTEGFSGSQLNNIKADIPLVELSYEPLAKTTEGPSGQLYVQAGLPVMESPSESLWITSEVSFGPQLDNIHADFPLIEPSHGSPSIITEGSTGQLNIQVDIPLLESSSETSWISTESSSGPQLNNIQADIPLIDPSHEHPSIIIEGSFGQLNDQADIPLMESSSDSSWTAIKGSSSPQFNSTQADMQFTELLSGSSFLLPESSTKPQSINIQPLPEPPFITTQSSGAQLHNVQADSSLLEPPSVSLSLSNERSSGPQSNNIQAEAEPLSIALEVGSGLQLNDTQADTSLLESALVSPSFATESSAEPQINNNQEGVLLLESSSISIPCQSSEEPQGNNIQANVQLLESSPVLPFPSENSTQPENFQPIALPMESSPVSPLVQTMISTESHSNDTLTDIPLMGSLLASSSPPTEGSTESQPNNIQSDIQFVQLLPIYSSIPTKSPVQLLLNDIQPQIAIGTSSPLTIENSIVSQFIETDLSEQESPSTSSIVSTICSPELQPNNRSDAQSPESVVAYTVPSTETSPESQASDIQSAYLVLESSSISTNVFSDPQPNYMKADIPPLEPPFPTPREAQPSSVQTDLPLTESSSISEFSPIAIESSAEPPPYNVHEHISFIETTLGTLPPSIENIPDSQPSNNNENSPWLFTIPTCSAEESLLNTIQMETALTESSSVSTCPTDNISDHDGKPNGSKSGVSSEEISVLPIPLPEDILSCQFLTPCLPSDHSPEHPLRSSSPSCETVSAEKVILFEDLYPGSPPVNGNLVVIESVPTDNPGEFKEKPTCNVLDIAPVHDVPSSNNIIEGEDPASDPKLIASCEHLLKQFHNSSEALL